MADRVSGSRARVTALVVGVAVVALAALAVVEVRGADADRSGPGQSLVRGDTHVLDDPADSRATLVEFLDLECEACAAAYPLVEQARERYEGELTFAIRYFPLDGHLNSRNAAHAVEAAARQGRVEDMYSRMFATQEAWGDQRVDHSATFRGFADDLGLDMAAFDRDVGSAEVAERVDSDHRDGLALGVSGTPTFFLDGERFEPRSVDDFFDRLDEAVGR